MNTTAPNPAGDAPGGAVVRVLRMVPGYRSVENFFERVSTVPGRLSAMESQLARLAAIESEIVRLRSDVTHIREQALVAAVVSRNDQIGLEHRIDLMHDDVLRMSSRSRASHPVPADRSVDAG